MVQTVTSLLLRLGFGFLLACTASRAHCQVNVEPLRAQLEERGHTLNLKASMTAFQGNSEGLNLNAATLAGLSSEKNLAYLSVSADYARSAQATTLSKLFAHARYSRRLSRLLLAEAFLQWERDRFRRITSRQLFGAGPRFELARAQTTELALGIAYMLEITRRRQPPADHTRHRLSNYAAFTYHPHPRITLSETAYFQPRILRPSDYFLLSVFSARFEVTPSLSSSVDLSFRRENAAPTGVKPTDLQLASALSLTF